MSHLARLGICGVLALGVETIDAQPWDFGGAIDVTAMHGPGIFHHLESSGRRNIAVAEETVAVGWEDNRDGTPRVYLARKPIDATHFEEAMRISGDGEAYEPSLAAVGDGRFFVAWEENAQIHGRMVKPKALGPILKIGASASAQANVSISDDRIFVLYSRRDERFSHIRLAVLRSEGAHSMRLESECAVDPDPPGDDQIYPASAVAGDELVAAWEDRRPGHTIILASMAKLSDPCGFSDPVRVSEPRPRSGSGYGKGHGVSRVSLAPFGSSGVMAVWADKRDYWEGYDIYSAAYLGGSVFGANEKVQDEFGDFARQWHAVVSGHGDGRVAVAWTDERESDSDVLLSWLAEGVWSEDLALPGASGAGYQTHPSIALDARGNLHAAWIDRETADRPTRLRYLFGRVEIVER